MDPHFPKVPAFVLNFLLGVVVPYVHSQVKRLLETEFDDPKKPHPQRMAAKSELYGRVCQALEKGMLKHYGICLPSGFERAASLNA